MSNSAETLGPGEPARVHPEQVQSSSDPDCTFTRRLSALEGGAAGFLCVSSSAALTLAAAVSAGLGGRALHHVDLGDDAQDWFTRGGSALGLHAEPVSAHDPAKVADGLAHGARALFVPQVGYHSAREIDVRALSWHCRSFGALLCVDNSAPSPLARTPLRQGADLVLHTDLRWLGGDPDAREASLVVRDPVLALKVRGVARALGALQHDDARLRRLADGLASFAVRHEHAQRSARQLVERLQAAGAALRVTYPGVGSALRIAFTEPAAAARVHALAAAQLHDDTAELLPCARSLDAASARPNALRLQLGLAGVDHVWEALSAAIAAVPEALVAPRSSAP